MDSENVRYLLWGVLIAGVFGLASLLGGGSLWKRMLRSIGLATGLGFIVFPDSQTGEIGVKHLLTLFMELPGHPYPIGQVLAASLGLAFWCIWLVIAFVLLGFVRERARAAEPQEPPPPLQERQEPRLDTEEAV